ncbi:enoyl-CoA hydratase/isomerase family protein [Cupriavidus basilensis]
MIVRRASGVLFATLNIPATRNALAPEVVAALAATVEQAEADPEVRALVLRGAGGIFSAGGNVGNFQARLQADASQEDPVAARNRQFGYFMERLSVLPVPVIAAWTARPWAAAWAWRARRISCWPRATHASRCRRRR